MKLLIVPDIHCRHELVTMAFDKFLKEKYDKIIFLGDYCDSYDRSNEDMLRCFNILLSMRIILGDRLILLVGNHDEFYFSQDGEYRSSGSRVDFHKSLYPLLNDNRKSFRHAYSVGNYLFTHAGVSQSWYVSHYRTLRKWAEVMALDIDNPKDLGDIIDGVSYTSDKPCLLEIGPLRGGWKNGLGGPLWCDKKEILDHFPVAGVHQIVGHTPTHFITKVSAFGKDHRLEYPDTSITFCDVLDYKQQFLKLTIDN